MIARELVISGMVFVLAAVVAPRGVCAQASVAPAPQHGDTVVRPAGRAVYARGGTLVAERTIGVAEGAPEYMFGSVRDVLELRDGSTLVLDSRAFAIRQYDAKGTHIRTIGRRGQGPGEYTRPARLAELPDGRILLLDGGNARVNVYARDGEPTESWSLAFAGGRVTAGRLTVDTTGTAVVSLYASGGGITEGDRVLRFAPNGRIVDTVEAPVFAYKPPNAELKTARGNAMAIIPHYPVTEWVWSPLGYLVTGDANRYAFELRIPRPARETASVAIPVMRYRGPTPAWTAGDPVVSVRHTTTPVPISAEQRSVAKSDVEAILRQLEPTYRYSGPEIPTTRPPWKGLRVGEDGSIWVQLSMPGERYIPEANDVPSAGPVLPKWREPVVYDVFEPDGRYLGRVTRPSDVTVIRMTRDRIWASVRDEDDVEVVKRFRIDWR